MKKSVPLYEKIYEDILNDIRQGIYPPGGKIPSEKELSQTYSVSRITSKKALEKLAEQELIIRMPGRGSFVAGEADPPVAAANTLRNRNQTTLIGVIMDGFGASFGYEILLGIESECKRQNLSFLLKCSYGDEKVESKAVDELLELGVAGIIIMCVHEENYNANVLKLVVDGFPIVTIDRRLERIPVSYVGTDNKKAARDLTIHLINKGCKNICFVSPHAVNTPAIIDRRSGFRECCREYGLSTEESIMDIRSTLPSFRNEENLEKDKTIIKEYIRSHKCIDAFFAVEYEIARLINRILKDMGLKSKYPIVCFDDVRNNLMESQFTHVSQREEEIGRESTKLLARQMKGEKSVEVILVPYDILEATV